jgi:hypothetical protein
VAPLQQPFGQVAALQAHVPPVLSQRPLAQAAQTAPPAPHVDADSLASATHEPPTTAVQQPFGQDAASQTHAPCVVSHRWPAPQPPHAAPLWPHEPLPSEAYGTQVLPLQQPAGQDVASQTHCPVEVLHRWPELHAAQVAPDAPQAPLVSPTSGLHVPPLQHPAHEAPPQLHAPLEHACPDAQAAQAAPAVPHPFADCRPKATQVLPLQQPFGHEVASHTHWPLLLLHSRLAPHAAHVAPPVPHDEFPSEA